MDKELIIFDLDGTLIDSSGDIAWVANRVLESIGRPVLDPEEIKKKIGWGIKQLLTELLPDEKPEVIESARKRFLDIYGNHLVVETRPYPGVVETLEHFSRLGKKMALVTNKPESLAIGILEQLDLSDFFGVVLGGDSLSRRKPHPEPVEKVLSELGVAPEKGVFVGDSPIDCETGKAAGLCTIGAAYGFRGRPELEEAGCDVIIEDFSELKRLIR